MRSLVAPLDRMIRRLGQNPFIAGIVLTVVTIVLIGGVVLTMTSAGCGPAKALGLKGTFNRCAASLTARSSPSASPSALPTSTSSPTPSTAPSAPPVPPPVQPVPPPNSGPIPPNSDPSSPGGTPAYPTVADASGSGGSAPASLNCRLPVYVGPAGSGGFIVFPGNTFVADPGSGVTTPSPSPGSPTPSPLQGYGPGGPGMPFGLSYDRTYSRWLPVTIQAVSTDGTLYAFGTANSIFVVTVSSGAMTELGKGHAWTILSVSPAGVYATIPGASGLWVIPYSGATPQQVTATGYWQAVGGGAAYGTATSAVPQGTPSTIQRLDVSTGAIRDYFTRVGMQSNVAGFDAQGVPVIYASGTSGNEVWIGNLFLMSYRYQQYGGAVGFNAGGPPVADSHGLWFSGYYQNGNIGAGPAIVVYIPGSGVYAVSSIGAQLAGGCY